MSDIVFILGAGASKQAGAPLMGNFLDVANDLFRLRKAKDYEESFNNVFNAIGGLQAVHSKAELDLNNIESIFTALELGNIIQSFPGMSSDAIPGAIADLKRLIVKTLETTIAYPVKGGRLFAPKPYPAFASLIEQIATRGLPTKSSSVITFNYDLCVDLALYGEDLGPNYIIRNAPETHRKQVDLLKLHGSLNWGVEVASEKILPVHLSDYLGRRPMFDKDTKSIELNIGTTLPRIFSEKGSIEVHHEPVIVPPSWNKADYHRALSNVWAAAAKHLSEAEHIFVIGYSLPDTDSFFRHLFALGSVSKTTLRNFVVFNPDNSVDARFRSLLGRGALARYRFSEKTFEEAIEDIKDIFPVRSR